MTTDLMAIRLTIRRCARRIRTMIPGLLLLAAGLLVAPQQASAAMLYVVTANQVSYVGDEFVVEWFLDTQGQPVNTLSLVLTYSADKLEVADIGPGASAVDLWVESPEADQDAGTIRLVGGISSGANDSHLAVFRVAFRPTAVGEAKISMAPESELLLSDGQGTPAALVFNEVNFRVNPASAKPAGILPPPHIDQNSWSSDRHITFRVDMKPGEEYSYSFSSNADIFPDDTPDAVDGELSFADLPDGIYYFKLNSRTGTGNWQEVGVYRVMIDTTPPEEFVPYVGQDPGVFGGQPFVAFNTTDSVSGVEYYEVRTGLLGTWERVENGYVRLPGLVLGDTIEVKAVDAAGNERVAEVQVDRSMLNSVFSQPWFWVILMTCLAAALWAIRQYIRILKKYKVQ